MACETNLVNFGKFARLFADQDTISLVGVHRLVSNLASFSEADVATFQLALDLSVPKHFLIQLLYVEDKRFLSHFGIDPIAIVRAINANGARRNSLQGASTITQQLYNTRIASAGGRRHRTLFNKVLQAAWALSEERHRSKYDILNEYLNTVYWGHSYYGVDEAASGYFCATRNQLTVAQSFFLAERLASPNLANPTRVEALLKRDFFSQLFFQNIASQKELIAIYNEHFSCGDAVDRFCRVDLLS